MFTQPNPTQIGEKLCSLGGTKEGRSNIYLHNPPSKLIIFSLMNAEVWLNSFVGATKMPCLSSLVIIEPVETF